MKTWRGLDFKAPPFRKMHLKTQRGHCSPGQMGVTEWKSNIRFSLLLRELETFSKKKQKAVDRAGVASWV